MPLPNIVLCPYCNEITQRNCNNTFSLCHKDTHLFMKENETTWYLVDKTTKPFLLINKNEIRYYYVKRKAIIHQFIKPISINDATNIIKKYIKLHAFT